MRTAPKTWLGLAVAALLVVLLLALGVYAYDRIGIPGETGLFEGTAGGTQTGVKTRITAFTAERPNFVVEGYGLTKVQVWAVPSGTGVAEDDHRLLGEAVLRPESGTSAQVWTLPIPSESMTVTEIYARGFDRQDAGVVRMSLPYAGATAIYDAVWNPETGAADGSRQDFSFIMAVGQKRTVGSLSVRMARIVNDSRCPQNAVCIWAGEVAVAVELAANGRNESVELHSAGPAHLFENYRIGIAGVSPLRRTGGTLVQSDYRVELTAQRL